MEENKRKKWDDLEINFLKINYSNMFNTDLCKTLKRTEQSIYLKANKLGLKKTLEHKSRCITKRNKMVGRNLTDELLFEIAKKYKTKSEFQKYDSSAYSSAKRRGVLNDICKHMICKSFSIPQLILRNIVSKLYNTENLLYNDRKTINPYEIDVYLPDKKIAFEYNGKGWHIQNKRDEIKKIILEQKGITLIVINENNRNYEQDIKEQLISNIKNLKLIISPQKINEIIVENPYKEIYDINDLKKVTKKYSSFKIFYKQEQKVYQKILKLKLVDELTNHMCCRRKKINKDDVINSIKKYEYLLDFIREKNNLYQYIKKNKLEFLLKDLKRK